MRNGIQNLLWLLHKRITIRSSSRKVPLIMFLLVSYSPSLLESSILLLPLWKGISKFCILFAGTVIDNTVCHPRNNDFYLCAHAGMIVRSTKYHLCVLILSSHDCLMLSMKCMLCFPCAGHYEANTLPCSVGWNWFFTWWSAGTCSFLVLCVSSSDHCSFLSDC